MKRPVVTAMFLFALAGLAGCPIYDHESAGCFRNSDCAQNYFCDSASGDCRLATTGYTCSQPSDCAETSTCTASGQCMIGDCSFYNHACVAGFRCDSSSGIWQCVANGTAEAGVSGAGGAPSEGGSLAVAGASGASETSTGGVAGAE
jgi:hypothetical protein